MRGGLIGAIAAGGIPHTVTEQIGWTSTALLHKARIVPSTQRHTQAAWACVANPKAAVIARTKRWLIVAPRSCR
jgi:hypothetical protein